MEEIALKKRTVTLPCDFGTVIYSIIGEKVHPLIVEGFQVNNDDILLVTEGMYLKQSLFGKYYFFDQAIAEYELKRRREEKPIIEVRRDRS